MCCSSLLSACIAGEGKTSSGHGVGKRVLTGSGRDKRHPITTAITGTHLKGILTHRVTDDYLIRADWEQVLGHQVRIKPISLEGSGSQILRVCCAFLRVTAHLTLTCW